MVAIFGIIIPAPLLIPEIAISQPETLTVRLTPLGLVSVVIMPSAASAQAPSFNSASAVGKPDTIGETGKASPMTPVENGKIASSATPVNSANALQQALASVMP